MAGGDEAQRPLEREVLAFSRLAGDQDGRLDPLVVDVAPERRAVRSHRDLELAPPESGSTVCTTPLPNVFEPITVPRPWSCRAPVTISEALAVLPLTRTTSGSVVGVPPVVLITSFAECAPWVVTTTLPAGRKSLATLCASLTSPPPLSRRSKTIHCAPRRCSAATASWTRVPAPLANELSDT